MVSAGTHIKDRVKRELTKQKRDSCRYYAKKYGACLIRKQMSCHNCLDSEEKTKEKLTKVIT